MSCKMSLDELALQQLGYCPSNQDLDFDFETVFSYLKELKAHIEACPNDTNFRVEATPMTGYGVAWCLESGCQNRIVLLTRREDLPDGGLACGIGSLAAYREHALKSVLHQLGRDGRLSRREGFSANPELERLNSGAGLSAQASSTSSSPTSTSNMETECTVAVSNILPPRLVISISADSVLPRKRPAEDQSIPQPKAEEDDLPEAPPQKRARLQFGYPLQVNIHKIRNILSKLQRAILIVETKLEIASQPPGRERIHILEVERDNLKQVKMLYDAACSALEPPPRAHTPSATYSSNRQERSHSRSGPSGYPRQFDLHKIRNILSELQRAILTVEAKLEIASQPPERERIHILEVERDNLKQVKMLYDAVCSALKPPPRAHTPSATYSTNRQECSDFGLSENPLPDHAEDPAYVTNDIVSPPGAVGTAVDPDPELNQSSRSNSCAPYAAPIASGSNLASQPNPSTSEYEDDESDRGSFDASEGRSVVFPTDLRSNDLLPVNSTTLSRGGHNNRDLSVGRHVLHFGPAATTEDLHQFVKIAEEAEPIDGDGSVDRALAQLGLDDVSAMLSGMKVVLKPYQAIGVAWMLEMERGIHKGGILADDMGLGKTIQTIATMVLNRPETTKPTLIVCPVNLLSQWKQEIEEKTNVGYKCLIYQGVHRAKHAQDLLKYDVVLTNYETLVSEYPEDKVDWAKRMKKEKKARTAGVDHSGKRSRRGRTKSGPLFNVNWARVVLDEAQKIRNHETCNSRAVTKLDATYKWCLTGTPIMNCLPDAYGLIRFLGIHPWDDPEFFKQHILTPGLTQPNVAPNTLQMVLRPIMLRRLKNSILDDMPLTKLPDKEVKLVKLEFSKTEREIYKMVETNSQNKVAQFLREGTVLKNYCYVLVLLMRLRQACVHASLITEAARGQREEGSQRTDRLSSGYAIGYDTTSDSEDDSEDDGEAELIRQDKGKGKARAEDDFEMNVDELCGREPDWERITAPGSILNNVPSMPTSFPSTKMKYMIDTILEWAQSDPNDKVLVISQWTKALDLAAGYLKKEGIDYVRYQGDMNRAERDRAIDAFMNGDETTVMLMSLTCGGVGLNLTRANRVISLDLGWNEAVESQAFDRVHRVGQKKAVLVERVVIKDTIEDRILDLQERKKKLADSCFGEGNGEKLGKQTIKDLVRLLKLDLHGNRL